MEIQSQSCSSDAQSGCNTHPLAILAVAQSGCFLWCRWILGVCSSWELPSSAGLAAKINHGSIAGPCAAYSGARGAFPMQLALEAPSRRRGGRLTATGDAFAGGLCRCPFCRSCDAAVCEGDEAARGKMKGQFYSGCRQMGGPVGSNIAQEHTPTFETGTPAHSRCRPG